MIKESNLLAKELRRKVAFAIKLINIIPDTVAINPLEEFEKTTSELNVEVNSIEYNMCWLWSWEKFEDRLYMIKDMLED